jgi:hypothetical protein
MNTHYATPTKFKCHDKTRHPNNVADNDEATICGEIYPYPDFDRNLFCIHLQIRSQYMQYIFEAPVAHFDTSYETVILFVVSSHEHSNSNGAMLALSFCCTCNE